MVTRSTDIKNAVSLVLSVLASLISLGGIAYAAGSLNQRVTAVEEGKKKLEDVPSDIAVMKRDLAWLVRREQRREDRNDN